MMNNDDYVIDWQLIEYELNENELLALSEVQTQSIIGNNTKKVFKTVTAPVQIGGRIAKNQLQNWHPVQGVRKMGGMLFTGRLLRSPLVKAGFWIRLIEKIKEIWQKFKNKLAAIFRSDQGFVNKELYNAEAIIKNAVAQDAVDGTGKLDTQFENIRPYWNADRYIESVQIPPLNVNDSGMLNALSDKNTFVAYYIRNLSTIDFNSGDCVDRLNAFFSGGNPVNCTLFDLIPYVSKIIEYCVDNERTIASLEQTKNNLIKAAEDVMRTIEQSGLVQEADNFGENVDDRKAEMIQDMATKVRNYISVVQTINGSKMNCVEDRFRQSVNIMREVLLRCRAVNKDQIENAKIARHSRVIEENPKNAKEPKQYGDTPIGNFMDQMQARKKIKISKKDNKRGTIEVNQEYLDTMSTSPRKLLNQASRIKRSRDDLLKFIKKSRMGETDPRFKPLYDQAMEYDRHLAVIKKRISDLENQKKDED